MKKLLVVLCIVNITLSCSYPLFFGSEIAIHFNASGEADNFASPYALSVFLVLLGLFFCALGLFVPVMIDKAPKSSINIPNKEFWLSEENYPTFQRKFSSYWAEYNAILQLFLITICVLTIYANTLESPRLPMIPFAIALVSYLAYTGIWALRFIKVMKVPSVGDQTPAR